MEEEEDEIAGESTSMSRKTGKLSEEELVDHVYTVRVAMRRTFPSLLATLGSMLGDELCTISSIDGTKRSASSSSASASSQIRARRENEGTGGLLLCCLPPPASLHIHRYWATKRKAADDAACLRCYQRFPFVENWSTDTYRPFDLTASLTRRIRLRRIGAPASLVRDPSECAGAAKEAEAAGGEGGG